jgi:tRNA-specific 2-thiouridylase
LLAGKDSNKDQSYFLCQLSQEQLAKSLFPIGELTKPQVSEIATQNRFGYCRKERFARTLFHRKSAIARIFTTKITTQRRIIFEVDNDSEIYNQQKPVFNNLEEELMYLSTPIVYTPEAGKVVGKHQGAHYFTIGQRKGLNVGGTKEALFIIATDVKTNAIYTGQGHNHKGLFRKALKINPSEIHWIRKDLALKNGESMQVTARIRYRQELQQATLYQFENGLYVLFNEPQSAITEGQFVAWNIDDELVGSGVIS